MRRRKIRYSSAGRRKKAAMSAEKVLKGKRRTWEGSQGEKEGGKKAATYFPKFSGGTCWAGRMLLFQEEKGGI